jgi:hypothetical protein
MSFLFPLFLFVIFIACVAFVFTEGMWGAGVRLINVVMAALLATNFWEPTAEFLEGVVGSSFTYWLDFVALWGLFAVFMLVFRLLTNRFSRVNVRFLSMADRIGGGVFSIFVGWTMVCFTTFTLHTAPLGEKFMFGGFDPSNPVMLKPDRQWWSFVHIVSKGSLSRGGPEGGHVFDPNLKFIDTYRARRSALESLVSSSKTFRASSGVPARGGARPAPPPSQGEEGQEEDAGEE